MRPRVQCYYCGRKLTKKEYSEDHVVPRCKGGSDKPYNKVPSCKKCNVEKGCLSLEEYRVVIAYRRGLLSKINISFFGEV
jgi:5-methylcytosine-specific restriction endonuclease McrA